MLPSAADSRLVALVILGSSEQLIQLNARNVFYNSNYVFAGDWQTVHIPWREFVGVTRAKFDPSAPPLNPANIHQVGFRLSRFDFNNLANPHYKPGAFSLQVTTFGGHGPPLYSLPAGKPASWRASACLCCRD